VSESPPPFTGRLPRIRGTQVGLRDPAAVDGIKRDMREGRFAYHEPRGRVGGYRDSRGARHVIEGHHRMVAALEILTETGDEMPLRELLRWGLWADVPMAPTDSRPMPSRRWWGALRNRWNF
jgi:filamentous hemagglutinin